MREIKFRAKSMSKKDTEWHYGLLRSESSGYDTGFLQDKHRNCIHINLNTVGQFTGVLDVNGVEIYEGDIVKLVEDTSREDDFEPFIAGVVKFGYGNFYIADGAISRYCWVDYILEVVGDIYENPELLEVFDDK